MRSKKTRAEVNKDVRRVLARHGVDTVELNFQVYGKEISFYGKLMHGDGSEFSAIEVENMMGEFSEIIGGYNITGDTSNWIFTYQAIRHIGERTKAQEDAEKRKEREAKEEEED